MGYVQLQLLYPWAVVAGYRGQVTLRARVGGSAALAGAVPYSCFCTMSSEGGGASKVLELEQLEPSTVYEDGIMEIVCRAPDLPEGIAWLYLRGVNGSTVYSEKVPMLVLRPSLHAVQREVCLALRDNSPPHPALLGEIFKAVHLVSRSSRISVEELAEYLKMAVTHGWEGLVVAIAGKLKSDEELTQLLSLANLGPLSLVTRAVMGGNGPVIAKMRRSIGHDPCVARIPGTFTALHWSAALGPAEALAGSRPKLQQSWRRQRAGPGAGLTPSELNEGWKATRCLSGPEDHPDWPGLWQIPSGQLVLQMGCAADSRHWHTLQEEVQALNLQDVLAERNILPANPHPLVPDDTKPLQAVPTETVAAAAGQPADGCTPSDTALHLALFGLPCLLALLSFPADSVEDLLWLVLLAVAVLVPVVFSCRTVLPEVCRSRQKLLGRLRQEASCLGAGWLGDNFEFDDPGLQSEYEAFCLAGGSLVLGSLLTCGKMMAAWLLMIAIRGLDNTGQVLLELGLHWLALSLLHGGLLAVLDRKSARAVNATIASLYMGLPPPSTNCCALPALNPLISSALPCPEWPVEVLQGPVEGWTIVWLVLIPSLIAMATSCLFAPFFPTTPSRLYVARGAVHLALWPALMCRVAGPGCSASGAGRLPLLVFHSACSFAVSTTALVSACYMWRLREASLLRGFLTSQQFQQVLAAQSN